MEVLEAYRFLKPICELGNVRGRTKVQKIFYLLRAAGYPADIDYFLHYFGPYSETLSAYLTWAGQQALVEEACATLSAEAVRCDYSATPAARELVGSLQNVVEPVEVETVSRYCEFARQLNKENSSVLELAATIAYFVRDRGCQLLEACEKTKAFKPNKARPADMETARAIAERALQFN
jgi:uncharacterized protein YwgA